MEPPSVTRSTATVISPVVIAATVMIAATAVTIAAATGAGITAGIGIAATARVGSRSRATPTTATPGQGVGGQEERGRAGGNSESEDFAQHSLLIGF